MMTYFFIAPPRSGYIISVLIINYTVFAKNNKKIISTEGEVSSGTVSNVQINGKDGGIRFNTATPITTKEITL
jgi:hypothetical protein